MGKLTGSDPTVVRTDRGLSIAGTRITLYHIMDYVKAGWAPRLIQDWLSLTDRQIADVMAYLAEHEAAVEVEYQQVLQDAEEIRRHWEERNRERFAEIAASPPNPEFAELRAKLVAWKSKPDR